MADSELMDSEIFNKFCDLIGQKAGLKLGPQKEVLVNARIGRRMRALRIEDHGQYFKLVRNDRSGEEMVELLNAISTNLTHFFREEEHFDLLSQIVGGWENKGQSRFRVWSAASSSGEEPYSIAITLRETLQRECDIKILATDISTRMLEAASRGEYEQRDIVSVPRQLLSRYFEKQPITETYLVKEDLKKMITYGRINLAQHPYPLHGPLDVVFCRNVMIYFDNEIREGVVAEMFRLLKPGGYLLVGHSECLQKKQSDLKCLQPSVYIKPAGRGDSKS